VLVAVLLDVATYAILAIVCSLIQARDFLIEKRPKTLNFIFLISQISF